MLCFVLKLVYAISLRHKKIDENNPHSYTWTFYLFILKNIVNENPQADLH